MGWSKRGLMILRSLGVSLFTAALVVACSDDEGSGPSQEIKNFCSSLFASPAFSCCSANDRNERLFAARIRYNSADDCANRLAEQLSTSQGRQAFDGAAASSCLQHLSGRSCNTPISTAARIAEEKAGCGRVVAGAQDEGKVCQIHADCKAGLVCPPIKETGLSFCVKPGGTNENCIGAEELSPTAVDHPACVAGFTCALTAENPPSACPLPPCNVYNCVPLGEAGDGCVGNDCREGLLCLQGTCVEGGPSAAGGPCRLFEHCQAGLYCDTSTLTCQPQKSAGEPCVSTANALLECKGFCQGSGEGPGVCAPFCSSQ